MKLEGSLDAFSLPDIFQLLSFTKKSGGLRLQQDASDGVVYFSDGFITGAAADGSRQSLARRLIGSGVVDDEGLAAAVAAASAEGSESGVGALLVEFGSVDSELIRQAATEQTMDSVFDLLRWPEGDFAFSVDGRNPNDVGIRLTPDAVVAEATQRQTAWELIAAVIPGPDTVLTMPVVLAVEPAVSKDEWALLALVDGRRRVGDLVELTGCGQFAVVSSLSSLVDRGLLQVKGEHDHVTTVARRQALLEPLEHRNGVAETAESTPAAVPEDAENTTSDKPVEKPNAEPAAKPASDADVEPAEGVETDEPTTEPAVAQKSPPAEQADRPAMRAVAADVQHSPAQEARSQSDEVKQPAARADGMRQPGDVVPPRPEPFRPARRPDHPEPAVGAPLRGVPSAPQASGGAAVAADPAAALIERDPSVNRSLLLRLIAGVRGL